MTQQTAILSHLIEHKTITNIEAVKLYGATRLGGQIFEPRKKGYPIRTMMVDTTNQYGQPTRYARYYLPEVDNE